MGQMNELLKSARAKGCSDVHLTANLPPMVRQNGKLKPMSEFPVLDDEKLISFAREMLEQVGINWSEQADKMLDIDFCYADDNGGRNRVNIYHQQKHVAVAIRLLSMNIPSMEQLGLPKILKDLAMLKRGLVLVTGPTGSGKSTTLASCIDYINENRNEHIITIEDPVEYLHKNKGCMINQREVGMDTDEFAGALRSALREDPDIILVGEMRDLETIQAAVTAAETGHLVFSTLHTTGAAATIDRIIDVFPPHQQQQIRVQLSSVLKAVISQQLIPKADGSGRVAAEEILLVTDAVANMIRENKCHQITSVLQTGTRLGMQSMDSELIALASNGVIAADMAVDYGIDKAMLMQRLYQ